MSVIIVGSDASLLQCLLIILALLIQLLLILLGQSVRNRTVLKYDPSTKQVIQVPKSELGNSVEVLRPASDIVVETTEEVETRFDNTLD